MSTKLLDPFKANILENSKTVNISNCITPTKYYK